MRRRHFLAGAAGAGLGVGLAGTGWARAGAPLWITAGNLADKSSWLLGLTATGGIAFRQPIPGRGHAAAAHPQRAEAVAFARRPGRFALVLNCASGDEIARLDSPPGRHFYGHGAFTADGRYLLTTENDWDGPAGRLGVWDATAGYQRVDEIPSGGIGPHEIIRLPSGGFAVANGGIQTHPDFERAKLNLPDMRTNLTWLDPEGRIIATQELVGEMRQNSVRHLDTDATGRVFAALQWQGAPARKVPLVARFAPGQPPQLLDHPAQARLKHYAGSIAVTPDGGQIAVTGPKGGHVLFLDGEGRPDGHIALPVASGVAQAAGGFAITFQGGLALGRSGALRQLAIGGGWSWDNHLVRIG